MSKRLKHDYQHITNLVVIYYWDKLKFYQYIVIFDY